MASDKNYFFYVFPKTCDPRGGAILDPNGIIWTSLLEGYSMMQHTKKQGSMPCGFSQEYFFHVFPLECYVKHVTSRVVPFISPGALFEQTW